MANTVKRKIRFGTLFLFLLVLLSCGVGIFNIVRLKNDAKLILKSNYESLDYCHAMQRSLDSSSFLKSKSLTGFEIVLRLQEKNITEKGEELATKEIRKFFDQYRSGDSTSVALTNIRSGIQKVLALNMAAIEIKNQRATKTADNALTYITFLAAAVFLVGFSFSYNFPTILTNPISTIKEGIQEISRKNYKYRIHLEQKDEFGEMADAFNNMAERLEYFESSNLNKIIFEKTRAEAVINSLKEASIGIDKTGLILFANDQALQLLGLRSKDIVGKPVEDVSRHNDLFRFLLQEKTSLPFKIVVDNRENYFTKEILDIAQDGSSSKVIVLRNITSYKELDTAKTNFIATISHELKTPLASSDFGLKLLEDERVGHLSLEQKDLINNLKQDNQRMLRILSELLNMAQVEAGQIQLNISEANPESMMNNAVSSIQTTARERNILIEKLYAENLGTVSADADKTTWVLNNLLSNAVKYSPEGSQILVSLKHSENKMEFSVRDNGPGIPAEYQLKVFDRFFKVPGSKGGTGLGLAISKEFIEAQGGMIWVNSEIGAGTTFSFTLPLTNRNGEA